MSALVVLIGRIRCRSCDGGGWAWSGAKSSPRRPGSMTNGPLGGQVVAFCRPLAAHQRWIASHSHLSRRLDGTADGCSGSHFAVSRRFSTGRLAITRVFRFGEASLFKCSSSSTHQRHNKDPPWTPTSQVANVMKHKIGATQQVT